jgi:carbonic anhydrase
MTSTNHKCNQLIAQMKQGNKTFMNDRISQEERIKWSQKQEPCVAILSCSDSRVMSVRIFSENQLGNFFEVRTAGHVIQETIIESLKYAIEHLNVKFVLVMGHTKCGAVTSAVKSLYDPTIRDEYPAIISNLLPSVNAAILIYCRRNHMNSKELIDAVKGNQLVLDQLVYTSIIANTITIALKLSKSLNLELRNDILCENDVNRVCHQSSKVVITPILYDIESGQIQWKLY